MSFHTNRIYGTTIGTPKRPPRGDIVRTRQSCAPVARAAAPVEPVNPPAQGWPSIIGWFLGLAAAWKKDWWAAFTLPSVEECELDLTCPDCGRPLMTKCRCLAGE